MYERLSSLDLWISSKYPSVKYINTHRERERERERGDDREMAKDIMGILVFRYLS
jgi:hypothetical protein